MTIDEHELLSEYVREVASRAKGVDYDPFCWMLDEDGNDLDGDFCLACIKGLAPGVWEKYTDWTVAGYRLESDSIRHCEECGKVLDYSLTAWGVDEEFANFNAEPMDWDNPMHCFYMDRVVDGSDLQNDERAAELLQIFKSGIHAPILITH